MGACLNHFHGSSLQKLWVFFFPITVLIGDISECLNQCSPIFFMGWEISHPAHFQWDGMGMGAEGSQWAMGEIFENWMGTRILQRL